MDIKKVTGVYFSPAGSTKTVVETTVDELARLFKAECRYISLNTLSDRAQEYQFAPDELVVFGCPVYAGRLPNKISPDFARCLHGEGTPAVALVTYGGRAYDNALAEMCELLTKNNFKPAAGGAFLCRHVFSDKLAAGRPDAADLGELRMLAQGAALKLRSGGEIKPPKVPGDAQAAYYTPLKTDKTPAKFLKAKPTTAMVLCEHCGLCAKICPMGAIDPNDPSNIPGTCIKCCACTTYCPTGAKKFDDPDFLSHTAMLEQYYTALGARDINGLFAVTDNLTAEEQAQIEAESDVESYGDVKAYTISGPSDGTYIAFVSSRCKYLGINQTLPMLSEYYLYTKEDGSLKIMDDTDSDAAVTEAMKAALENEEVKNLIEQVQNDYQNALDADASLRAYVESIQ